MKKLLTIAAAGAMLTTAAVAGQLTVGDWDFMGLDCFPNFTPDWAFTADAGDGVVVTGVTATDVGGMMEYAVTYEGGGLITCILTNCDLGGTDGAIFDCDVPDDIFNHFLAEVIVEMPTTFCDFCFVEVPIPEEFALADAYPNPFNPNTTIDYSIAEPCFVTLTVFNIAGQEVVTLISDETEVGNFNVTFDGTDLASGVYFYRLNAGDFSAIKKMTLIK